MEKQVKGYHGKILEDPVSGVGGLRQQVLWVFEVVWWN